MTTWIKLSNTMRTEAAARALIAEKLASSPPQSSSCRHPLLSSSRSPPSRGSSGSPLSQSGVQSSPSYGRNMDPRFAQTHSGQEPPHGSYDSGRRLPSASPATRTPDPGHDSRRRSPSASPATHTLAVHGSSPARPPPGYGAGGYSAAGGYQQGQPGLAPPIAMASSSRQSSPARTGRSSRSPPDHTASPRPVRQREPERLRVDADTAAHAGVVVKRWGPRFEDTEFLVHSPYKQFTDFSVLGSDWKLAEIVGGSSRKGFVVGDSMNGYIYTHFVDPNVIGVGPDVDQRPPAWVTRQR